jgi:hypothetical protein
MTGMKKLLLLLSSRLFLFLLFQTLIALFLTSWEGSVKYWILSATLTNIVSIVLLITLFRQENLSYLSMFRFQKINFKVDLIWFLVLLLISVPIAIMPSLALSTLLWGNTEYYHQVLFQPLNRPLVYCLLFVYPITTGLAELATYFGYIMPRLKGYFKSQWIVIALPVLVFSLQHCTLPLVFETKFIFFRGFMYLLYALVYGIALYKRPSLLPWLAILQLLSYILPMYTLLTISQ